MKRRGKCSRFRDQQIRRPQERKECGRSKEQQEGHHRDGPNLHFDKNILMAVWGLDWQEVRVVQGDYLEHHYRSLG